MLMDLKVIICGVTSIKIIIIEQKLIAIILLLWKIPRTMDRLLHRLASITLNLYY